MNKVQIRKSFEFTLFSILFLSTNTIIVSAQCSPNFDVLMEFKSLSRDLIPSPAQNRLDFREDDILVLNRMDIVNKNGCNDEEWVANVEFINPQNNEEFGFGMGNLYIPPLEINDSYSLVFNKIATRKFGDTDFRVSNYSIFVNNNFVNYTTENRGTHELSIVGTYTINVYIHPKQDVENIRNPKYSQKVYVKEGNVYLTQPYFKVTDKTSHIERDLQYQNIFLGLIVAGIAIFGIIITAFFSDRQIRTATNLFKKEIELRAKHELEVQLDLLRSLETQIRCIDRDMTKHVEKIKKGKLAYLDVTELDSKYYATTLRLKIKNHETELLKEVLILIENSVKKINELLGTAKAVGETPKNPHYPALLAEFKELERFIKLARRDINKVLYH